MMGESPIEEQQDVVMVSPTGGGDPFRKKAYFLKPISSIDEPHFKLPQRFEARKWPLGVEFHGWRERQEDWSAWVDHLAPLHQSIWKKAGIYEAIFNSKYQIRKNTDLVYGFAEKWCSDTNTFFFPWGEATITLEDVMVLGGFSVVGESIFNPLESNELKQVQEKLIMARKEVIRVASTARDSKWLKKFMNSGSELEHEAFLAFWLSRYVFHDLDRSIQMRVFPIAIHLAWGTRIALAPAVLAIIYRDLSLLKRAIIALNELNARDGSSKLILKSPFHLVQVWAWERFLELRPKPNVIQYAEPRLARWNKVNALKVENLRRVLDLAGEAFVWRPYAMAIENWSFPKYYLEKEKRVLVGHGLEDDDEFLSFSICLRVSELAGLDTRKQYLPHRVAMQFGYDQDIPCIVARSNVTRKHCIKKTGTVRLYIPSRLSEPDVSTRYLKWWNESLLRTKQSPVSHEFPRMKDLEHSKVRKKINAIPFVISNGRNESNDSLVPPGFPPKCSRMEAGDSMDEDDLNISEYLSKRKKHKSVETIKGGSNSTAGESSVDIMMSDRSVKEVMLSPTLIWGCKAKRNMKNVMGSNASTRDNEMVSTIGNGWASRVEKQVTELQATVKRLELVVDKLETRIRSWYQSITVD